jgi:hypothetical protein
MVRRIGARFGAPRFFDDILGQGEKNVSFSEGMSFVVGPYDTQEHLQDGRKSGHPKDLLAANHQVDYGTRSQIDIGVMLRFPE